MSIVVEITNARVLEKSVDDAYATDVVTQAWHTRLEAAYRAQDQVDFHAGARGLIELGDQQRVLDIVQLDDHLAGLACLDVFDFPADQRNNFSSQAGGRDFNVLERRRP